MRISAVHIKNFRKLRDVSMTLEKNLTVIVGPNAMGKTSILEAVRLCKSILMPRTHDEAQQVLVALGAATPHIMFGEFQYDFASFSGNDKKPVEIKLSLGLSTADLDLLSGAIAHIAQNIISASLGQQNPQSRLGLIQYFSSQEGESHLTKVTADVKNRIDTVRKTNTIQLALTITPQEIKGADHIDQALGATLESLVEPSQAIFSYFPADRSIPAGEVAVQLHSGDMKAHVDSHFANAATKYPRLKQVIVNQLITRGKEELEKEFSLIFEHLLPGKSFIGLRQKAVGTISVRIRDNDSKHEFDIDSMSSGEKGLILTYLLLRTSLAKGGVVLIDEPELHLNPAVCKKILDFLNDHVCSPLAAQVILCTHSPEILTRAFERDEFELYELLNPDSLNPLYREDKEEMYQALKRLGVSPSDSLVSRGFIFVEGEDDVALYENGFSEAIQGYKIIQKKGRNEVEKEIAVLQQAETKGKLDKIHMFIFDNDRKPVSYKSSKYVKVIQLSRYCIENYLLDDRYIYNALRDNASVKPASRAALTTEIRDVAIGQLKLIAAVEVFGDLQELSCGMRVNKLRDKGFPEIANALREQLETVLTSLRALDFANWEGEFLAHCNEREVALLIEWDKKYLHLASGKLIFESLQRKYPIPRPSLAVKLMLMEQIAKAKTTDWQEINNFLLANL